MKVRVTTLTENTTTKGGTLAEHGLCMLVEVEGLRLLLDTGQTTTAVHNARALGADLAGLEGVVLSHGHEDHTGGLRAILAETGPVRVYGHPEVWRARYSTRNSPAGRYSGLPFRREQLESLGATFHLSEGPVALAEGIMTTGPVPRKSLFERLDGDLVVRAAEGWEQDQIPDDQALLVKTAKGLVVLLGCAHSGIVNTLRQAQEVAQEERIHAVLGGTHLGFSTPEQIDRTVEALEGFGIERLGVSHCTGLPAAARLAREFGSRFFFNNVGTITEL